MRCGNYERHNIGRLLQECERGLNVKFQFVLCSFLHKASYSLEPLLLLYFPRASLMVCLTINKKSLSPINSGHHSS